MLGDLICSTTDLVNVCPEYHAFTSVKEQSENLADDYAK
jgi:hypothetical protein